MPTTNFDVAIMSIREAHSSSSHVKACTQEFADAYIAYRIDGQNGLAEALALSTIRKHLLMIESYEAAAYIRDLIR